MLSGSWSGPLLSPSAFQVHLTFAVDMHTCKLCTRPTQGAESCPAPARWPWHVRWGSPLLKMPLPTKTPSTPICIISAASAGVGHAACRKVDDWEPAGRACTSVLAGQSPGRTGGVEGNQEQLKPSTGATGKSSPGQHKHLPSPAPGTARPGRQAGRSSSGAAQEPPVCAGRTCPGAWSGGPARRAP